MTADIRTALRSFVLSCFLPGEDPASLKDTTLLITTGVISSISMLELVTFIEETFSVKLRPDDLGADRLDSIDLMVELVQQRASRA